MTLEKTERLKSQSLAIRSFPIKKVINVVDAFMLDKHDEVKLFESKITEYLKPYCDLSGFDYLYPINGITEGLNYWMWGEERAIQVRKGDMSGLVGKKLGMFITGQAQIVWKEISVIYPLINQ